MTLRALRFEGDPLLLQVSEPVTQFDDALATLISDMFETMYAAPGRGLAAPQIGVSKRVFVVDTTWKEAEPTPMIFVNPRIVAQSDAQSTGTEACLSIPGKSYDVTRPAWVQVAWQDVEGNDCTGRFDGADAICICHENDHLDGILITQTGQLR